MIYHYINNTDGEGIRDNLLRRNACHELWTIFSGGLYYKNIDIENYIRPVLKFLSSCRIHLVIFLRYKCIYLFLSFIDNVGLELVITEKIYSYFALNIK